MTIFSDALRKYKIQIDIPAVTDRRRRGTYLLFSANSSRPAMCWLPIPWYIHDVSSIDPNECTACYCNSDHVCRFSIAIFLYIFFFTQKVILVAVFFFFFIQFLTVYNIISISISFSACNTQYIILRSDIRITNDFFSLILFRVTNN